MQYLLLSMHYQYMYSSGHAFM